MISLKKNDNKNDPSHSDTSPDSKEAIFGKVLNTGQAVKSKKDAYREEKNKKKAYLELGIALTALLAYSVFFFYDGVANYIGSSSELSQLNASIDKYNKEILPVLEEEKDLHKSAYDKEFKIFLDALETVFPEDENRLELVSLLESFSTEVGASLPPFELNAINFSPSQQKDGYMVTPFSMSILSSRAGFDRFLELIANSGLIYTDEDGEQIFRDTFIPLIAISNISVRYREDDELTGKDGGVEFSVKLNAYYRITLESQNNNQ